jgi:dihydroorotase
MSSTQNLHLKNVVFQGAHNAQEFKELFIIDGLIKFSSSAPKGEFKTIDLKGKLVFPAFVDVFAKLHCSNFNSIKNNLKHLSQSALSGGFSDVFYASSKAVDQPYVFDYLQRLNTETDGAKLYCIPALSKDFSGQSIVSISEFLELGANGFYDEPLNICYLKTLQRAFEQFQGSDAKIFLQPDDYELSCNGIMNKGVESLKLGLHGRPVTAETAYIAAVLELMRFFRGTQVHFCNISSARSVELIERAKNENLKVTASVNPFNLAFTEEALNDYDPLFKLNPPLRTESDRQALIQGLKYGVIDFITTNHSQQNNKNGEGFIQDAPFGSPTHETAFSLLNQILVNKSEMKLEKLIELLTVKPSRIANLKRNFEIKDGEPLDLAIFDPLEKWRPFPSNQSYELTGRITLALKDGKVV